MIMGKISKLTLPVAIIIASFILGCFIFATQVIEQRGSFGEEMTIEEFYNKRKNKSSVLDNY
jgi:hypothetical protein